MSDLTTAASIGIGTGVISASVLASFGVDPTAFGFGLVGAIILQTVLRKDDDPPRKLWPTMLLMIGSSLFAAVAAPVVTPMLISVDAAATSRASVHALVAAAAGLLAQPVLTILQRVAMERIGPLIERVLGGGKNNA